MATDTKNGSTSLTSSMTDLMTSLMVIFVLLLVATLNNASAEGEHTRNSILSNLTDALRDFIKTDGIKVEPDPADPLQVFIYVPLGPLNFEWKKSTITPDGAIFLKRFTPRLSSTVCSEQFREQLSSIIVEGHTDKTGPDELNLQLSQERSMAVVQEMLKSLGENSGDRKCFLKLLSASGRGSEDFLGDPNNQKDQDLSRRVQFKIRARSIEERDFTKRLGF